MKSSILQPRRVAPSETCAIADWYPGANLVDAYSVPLAANHGNVRQLANTVLGRPSPWAGRLMVIRDKIMKGFGVKTSKQIRGDRTHADRIDFFPVLSSTEHEVVLGEDDKHLDFRLSLIIERTEGAPDQLIATTVVRCHNTLGRVYLFVIRPFHTLIARSMVSRAASRH
jgi:hypothetical protein